MTRRLLILTLCASAWVSSACGRADEPTDRRSAPGAAEESQTSTSAPPPSPADPDRPRIVALGDSLTAGLGLDQSQAWPALLQRRLDDEGYDYHVVNAGLSGDTTAGGLRRLDWALDGDVRVLVVELGANDGLRGLSPAEMRRNLDGILTQATSRGITVLLCGMEAPPNFGRDYTREFRSVFADLAAEHDVAFLPFFLDGVAGDSALNQSDGIHPNVEGTRRVADLVWRHLEPLLERSSTAS